MKTVLLALMCIALIGLTSAVPQVIFTEINLTINNGNYSIQGEGINAIDNFPVVGNCTFNYQRNNIPITFSREIGENNTDIAILMNALATNQNLTSKWETCTQENAKLNATIQAMNQNEQYFQNFTQCQQELMNCNAQRVSQDSLTQAKDKELETLKQHRTFLLVGLILLGLYCYNLYSKVKIKTGRNPLDNLPKDVKI